MLSDSDGCPIAPVPCKYALSTSPPCPASSDSPSLSPSSPDCSSCYFWSFVDRLVRLVLLVFLMLLVLLVPLLPLSNPFSLPLFAQTTYPCTLRLSFPFRLPFSISVSVSLPILPFGRCYLIRAVVPLSPFLSSMPPSKEGERAPASKASADVDPASAAPAPPADPDADPLAFYVGGV